MIRIITVQRKYRMGLVKYRKFLLILVFIGSLYPLSWGQAVEFSASAPRAIELGEQFRVTYSLNAKGSDFEDPNFGNFRVLSGPNVSTSSSVQIINGSISQSVNYSYAYILLASTEGAQTISPAKVKVKGKLYESNALSIEVVKGAQANQPASGGTTQPGSVNRPSSSKSKLFVTVEVDRKTLYQGESLVAQIKLYTQQSLSGSKRLNFPLSLASGVRILKPLNKLSFTAKM